MYHVFVEKTRVILKAFQTKSRIESCQIFVNEVLTLFLHFNHIEIIDVYVYLIAWPFKMFLTVKFRASITNIKHMTNENKNEIVSKRRIIQLDKTKILSSPFL